MIVSKTPLRISFFSGGSDTPAFYKREDGAALSVTIDKFIHVIVRKTPNLPIKTMFDVVDESDNIEEMKHIISKESLKLFNIDSEITIASLSDIFSNGSGLGSFYAFTVGLVNSLFKINNTDALKETIAKESGAIGGKLLGAGGGEFFVFYVKEYKREEVIHTLKNKTNCKIFPFKFYDEGTKIMSYE